MQSLYYIAIVLSDQVNERIHRVKEEFASSYASSYALRNFAHITLCPPFKADKGFASALVKSLPKMSVRQESFELVLDGYKAFPPRVIYVKPEEEPKLRKLYYALKRHLIQYFPFENYHFGTGFTPHVTVANRDLTKEMFDKAWEAFSKRAFSGLEDVTAFSLLRHNGKQWVKIKDFPLAKKVTTQQSSLF